MLPFHEGAVKVYEEKGVWTADAEAHNQDLIRRQNVILATWKSFMAGDTPSDKAEFKKAWMALRAGALKNAGFEPIFM